MSPGGDLSIESPDFLWLRTADWGHL